MHTDEIHALVAGAPAAETVAAYPLPDDRILIAARDDSGALLSSFTVSLDTARRFTDGTMGASIILGLALGETDATGA